MQKRKSYDNIELLSSRSGGMADAADSKSADGDIVRVQVPPSAPDQNNTNQGYDSRFVLFFARDFFGMIVRLK